MVAILLGKCIKEIKMYEVKYYITEDNRVGKAISRLLCRTLL